MVGNSLIELSGSIKSGGEKWNQLNDKKELATRNDGNNKLQVSSVEEIWKDFSINFHPNRSGLVLCDVATDYWLLTSVSV